MINFDNYASENKTQQNLKWTYIPDREGSGSGKTNA